MRLDLQPKCIERRISRLRDHYSVNPWSVDRRGKVRKTTVAVPPEWNKVDAVRPCCCEPARTVRRPLPCKRIPNNNDDCREWTNTNGITRASRSSQPNKTQP